MGNDSEESITPSLTTMSFRTSDSEEKSFTPYMTALHVPMRSVKDFSSYLIRNDRVVKAPARAKNGATRTKISVYKPLIKQGSKALFSNYSGLPVLWLNVICNFIGTIPPGHFCDTFFHGFGGQPLAAQAIYQYREGKRCWAFNGF
jgi:hypothetical protein